MHLILADRARADLWSIARYTEREWGATRKKRYMAFLRERLGTLLRHPDLGPVRDDLGSGYRSLLAGSHMIFYRRAGEGIVVIRVLHQRMDIRRHL
ncbi:MAG: type II toxin-antitoxin system RelE/ParE family toxin [Alphaproteobacteria bacterium]|nr:type II toxin-antitoxin system RelE/ParE family toxin [Alphaproteobacteria bacterium]MBV9694965.1 type II toxin-antitoxin system RelE/ParE family toxin [Alphaproteobacteria bacterium]